MQYGRIGAGAEVTPREILEVNGDFRRSPLLDTARRIARAFDAAGVSYAIIGGLAVLHAGAVRTTEDVDVLTDRNGWDSIRTTLDGFTTSSDSAIDKENGIHVDLLFRGDDWGMLIPIPDPANIAEYDRELEAKFAGWRHLLVLKTAVYLAKKAEYGIEVAAKDLGDVVAIIEAHRSEITSLFALPMHPRIKRRLRRIVRRIPTR